MGDLAGAIGNGIGTLVSRSADVIGNVIGGVVRTFNGVLPGSAVLVVVGIVVAVFVIWAIRRP
jgi:phage gp37-like protein